ncbi:peptide ABC transporter substrate-binding protein [Clostridiisalibacter paucivorans]|uniref:peptide ABC transporter substrate-binding protein n=1 Tax=Clostridiisalibacter paucivorans TaxID=408753 RepID=UPI00047E237F|nr:peptide ABC transporter substrate-binding protein [Clostridiisalibacter paucivorans]
MYKKSLILLLVLVLVAGAFAGCSSESTTTDETAENQEEGTNSAQDTEGKDENIIRVNINSDPKTIDPQLNSAIDGGNIIMHMYEGLMREIDGKMEPAIAETYDVSDDGLKYTFNLRDAKWSDGEPVTAHDFEFAWKRALDPNTGSEYATQLFYIKGGQEFYEGKGSREDVAVKAVDEKTLEVELTGPTPYFLDLTAFFTYMPVREDIIAKDSDGWSRNPDVVVANGPFKLEEYVTGDKFVLTKNENYWNVENIKIDKLVASMIVESSTILTAYENGELDAIDNVPKQEIPKLLVEDPTFEIRPILATYFYIFNVTEPPVDDINVRKALTYAIDRKAIVETVTKGGEMPAAGLVPPGLTDSKGNNFRDVNGNFGIDPQKAQIEKAKEYLAKAGYPDGKGFPKTTMLYNTSESHKAVAEAIQEMWRKNLGIDIELANQEWAVFQDTRAQGNFVIARRGWFADYADPMTFLDLWTSYSGNNDAQWKTTDEHKFPNNEKYTELVEKSKVATGEERDELLYEAEKLIMEDMVVMPVYYYTDPTAVKDHIKDWYKTKLGYWYFGNAEIVK